MNTFETEVKDLREHLQKSQAEVQYWKDKTATLRANRVKYRQALMMFRNLNGHFSLECSDSICAPECRMIEELLDGDLGV